VLSAPRGGANTTELVRERERLRTNAAGARRAVRRGAPRRDRRTQSSERLKVQLADVDHKLAEVNGMPKAVRFVVNADDVRGGVGIAGNH
jgi:hypothetical protein